jgi:hypothetical protein
LLSEKCVAVVARIDQTCHDRKIAAGVAVASIAATASCVETGITYAVTQLRRSEIVTDRANVLSNCGAIPFVPITLWNVAVKVAEVVPEKI